MKGVESWVIIAAGVSIRLPSLNLADRLPGQLGRSLGPLTFCTLYWWGGREIAYAIGGAGMIGVCGLVFASLKAPQRSM